jgi:hypothetical protein
MIQQLEKICAKEQIPFTLCGDFNSEPITPMYMILSQGKLDEYWTSKLLGYPMGSKSKIVSNNWFHNTKVMYRIL